MGCGMYMDSSTLDHVQLADGQPNESVGRTPPIRPGRASRSHRSTGVLAAFAAALVLVSSAAASPSWHRVHVWKGHDASLTAKRYLPSGTWRLVYQARNPKTWMHVNLTCGSKQYADSYRVRSRRKTVAFKSSGCKLKVLMLGHITMNAAGMFMRVELDRR